MSDQAQLNYAMLKNCQRENKRLRKAIEDALTDQNGLWRELLMAALEVTE